MNLYRSATFYDEACDLFKQIAKEKRHYRDVDMYVNATCSQVPTILKKEANLFNKGHQELNQQLYLAAEQDLGNALKKSNLLKNPQHKNEIQADLSTIAEWKTREAQLSQRCNDLASSPSNLDDAIKTCNEVAAMGGPNAATAAEAAKTAANRRAPLTLAQAPAQKPQAIEQPPQTSNAGAIQGSNAVVTHEPPGNLSDEKNVVQSRQEAKNNLPAPVPPKPIRKDEPALVHSPGSASPKVDRLREGLRAFLQGEYGEADQDLSAYLAEGGSNMSLAYFFRGAAHGMTYFLSGEKDLESETEAVEDFRKAKHAQTRPLPLQKLENLIPPKILQLYRSAA